MANGKERTAIPPVTVLNGGLLIDMNRVEYDINRRSYVWTFSGTRAYEDAAELLRKVTGRVGFVRHFMKDGTVNEFAPVHGVGGEIVSVGRYPIVWEVRLFVQYLPGEVKWFGDEWYGKSVYEIHGRIGE